MVDRAYHVTTPQLLPPCIIKAQTIFHVISSHQVLKGRTAPEPLCEGRVVDLEAVIHAHCIALFRFARCRCQRQRGQEGDVGLAQGSSEEVWNGHDLAWEGGVEG